MNLVNVLLIVYNANFISILNYLYIFSKLTITYLYVLYQLIYMHESYESIKLFKCFDGLNSFGNNITMNKSNDNNNDIFIDKDEDVWGKVQLYSLSLIFKLWSLPHYRSASFQQDMIDNLKNVAIPGAVNKARFYYNEHTTHPSSVQPTLEEIVKYIVEQYYHHLFHPQDWFSLWRMNCRLVSYHSLVTKSLDYNQENKWTFLTEGKKLGVPVSPYFEASMIDSLVCKHKSIEGGMGIHFYKNAANGGDWILQERLTNDAWLNELLPSIAPLSTMRVITTSTWSLHHAKTSRDGDTINEQVYMKYIKAESGVLRLGRLNALTDHSSLLFDVDISTGQILQGTSNAHWYQLGMQSIHRCPWLPPKDTVTKHSDYPYPIVTGKVIPNMKEALSIVMRSHFQMMPDVPIVGWDVAFTPSGIYLLEVNLSCNFFKGTFDIHSYINQIDQYWKYLEAIERGVGTRTAQGSSSNENLTDTMDNHIITATEDNHVITATEDDVVVVDDNKKKDE